MSIYSIYICYQPTKNMKYMGPKSSLVVPIKKEKKTLIQHNINYMNNIFDDVKHHVVVGFEADKTIKLLDNIDKLSYNIILDYKNTNHGKIIKDILIKYDKLKFNGIFIVSDINCIITKPIPLDETKNYILTTNKNINNHDMTCNIIDNKIEHISYNTSDAYWSGMVYFSNETIRLLKHINNIKFTDPLFLFEIINYLIDSGVIFDNYYLKPRQHIYISNDILKSSKVCND